MVFDSKKLTGINKVERVSLILGAMVLNYPNYYTPNGDSVLVVYWTPENRLLFYLAPHPIHRTRLDRLDHSYHREVTAATCSQILRLMHEAWAPAFHCPSAFDLTSHNFHANHLIESFFKSRSSSICLEQHELLYSYRQSREPHQLDSSWRIHQIFHRRQSD